MATPEQGHGAPAGTSTVARPVNMQEFRNRQQQLEQAMAAMAAPPRALAQPAADESGVQEQQRGEHAQEPPVHVRRIGSVCFRFAQTGHCRFGDSCQYEHRPAESALHPERYTRYDVTWDDDPEDEAAQQRGALAQALEQARALKRAQQVEEADAHVPGSKVTFVPRSKRLDQEPRAKTQAPSRERKRTPADIWQDSAAVEVVEEDEPPVSGQKGLLAEEPVFQKPKGAKRPAKPRRQEND